MLSLTTSTLNSAPMKHSKLPDGPTVCVQRVWSGFVGYNDRYHNIALTTMAYGKPRIPVQEIPCADCGGIFGRTAFEMRRNRRSCPECHSKHNSAQTKTPKKRPPRSLYEIVLPKTKTPHWDKQRGEWYMRVRTRKRNSGEELVMEKVWLGVTDPDGDPLTAFTAAYARLQMKGASCNPVEAILKKAKKIGSIRRDAWDWGQGRDKNLGIERTVVKKICYKVYLPDPVIDKKRHYVGRFETRAEARAARDKKYKELQSILQPCALCGMLPSIRRGHLTHFSTDCTNDVQMPMGVRGLLQAKLWNLVFRHGKTPAGKLTKEDLCDMGYFYKPVKGFRYYARDNVSLDFSLAANYRKTPAVKEEDPTFE